MSDEQQIRNLAHKWLDAWNVGTSNFSPELFRDLFAPGKKGIEVFDNVKGDVLVIRSIDEYIQTWGLFMEPMTKWSVRLIDLKLKLSVDLAISTFKIVGVDTLGPDGSTIPFGQYGTHGWKKLPDIGWRIIHEHLTMFDINKRQNDQ